MTKIKRTKKGIRGDGCNQTYTNFFVFWDQGVCAGVHTLEERGVGEVTMCVHESKFF